MALIPTLIALPLAMIRIVPTGYTGVLVTFGRVEDKTIQAGAHIIAPWQNIVKMDNRSQKVSIETEAFSSDIQQVDIRATVNYCIDQKTAQNLYKTVGTGYYENIVYPRVLENVKATFAKYTAEALVANRNELSGVVGKAISNDMNPYGITIISVSVEDVDFTDAFTNAVEQKQVAEQNKLRAQTEQAQLTMEAQQAAERQVISANATAEVNRIQADTNLYAGQKEAQKNKELAESVDATLVDYYKALRWNGQLPSFVGGDTTLPILDIPVG